MTHRHAPPADPPLRLVISPCPNDTFVFRAWTEGLLPDVAAPTTTYADIDVANGIAERGEADVVKVSYGAVPWLLDRYRLLHCGGALGRGCGPLVLTAAPAPATALRGARVAVPGLRTTAYLLLRLWVRACVPGGVGDILVLPFEQVMPAVRDGRADAGLVIHESRFTYPSYGLSAVADLGDWWEAETGLAIPLGAIVARRTLDPVPLETAIRASLAHARADPAAARPHLLAHAQEMDPTVVEQHVALYVNDYTADLGPDGRRAVAGLLARAGTAGLVAPVADVFG